MDAAEALSELTEISSQIDAAVLLGADGSVVASTFADEATAARFAEAARALLDAAKAGGTGGQALVQLEAATLDGSVFVVRDEHRAVAAATKPEPTAGLVFYDLKSCLRAAATEGGDGRSRPRASRTRAKQEIESETAA